MRQGPLDCQQSLLDLRRENVDAAKDEHIVAPASDAASAPVPRRGKAPL